MAKQGIGVELNLSSEKARSEVLALIDELAKLEKMVDGVNGYEITLKTKLDSNMATQLKKVENQVKTTGKNSQKAISDAAKKSTNSIKTFAQNAKAEYEKVSKAAKKAANKTSKLFTTSGEVISGIGSVGERLNQAATQLSSTLMRPIRSVFSTARSYVTTTVSESMDQIKKLELAEIGLQNHFKSDTNFRIEDYIGRIRTTAERTQGLSAGDLADYISQLAPLSKGDSEAAFAATMGALKIIKYGGGDTNVDMMSIIKNIRDVQSKGKAYQMDLNQFNRAAPLLATMLEKQGMSQFIKRGTDGTVSLNITKDNYQGLLKAFANLNNNKELNDAFDAMTNTLSGILEQTKQSIQNDVVDLLKYEGKNGKSLLDIIKSWLGEAGESNSTFRTAMRNGLQRLFGEISDFLGSIRIGEVINTAFEALSEFGKYAKDELLPVIKELIGVGEDADATEVIKGLIKTAVKYLKSFVDGLKSFLSVVSWITKSLKGVFGEGNLVSFVGWVTGFNRMGWSLVQTLGSILKGIRNIPTILSNIKSGLKGFGNFLSGMSKFVGGAGGFIGGTGSSLMLLGLGSTVIDGIFNDDTAHNKEFKNSINSLTTGLGVGLMAGNPVFGALAAGVTNIVKYVWDMSKDIATIKAKYMQSEETNLNEMQQSLYDKIIAELADGDNPAYQAGDDASEYGATKLKEWLASNITGNETEEELYKKILDARGTYLWQKKYREGGNSLLSIANTYLKEGQTQLTKDNVNEAKNAENLKKYWDKLKEYGFVQNYEGWEIVDENPTGDNIWTFLTGKGISEVGSVEGLQNLVNNLGEVDKALATIDGQDAKLEIEVAASGNNEGQVAEAMKSYMNALGFTRETIDGKQVWATDVFIRDALEAGKVDGVEQGFSYDRGNEMGYKWNASHHPTLNDAQKQTLAKAYGIDSNSLMSQWQGANQKLLNGSLSPEDRQNYDGSLDNAIKNAIARLQLGDNLDDETARTVVWALEHRNGSWNEVVKMWGEQPALILAHGLNNIIGEETGVAVMGLTELLSNKLYKGNIPTLGISGSGTEEIKQALFNGKDNHVGLAVGGANSIEKIWENLKRQYQKVQSTYKADGGYIAPAPRKPKPLFFNWGGSARGVDTVPAMLSPGEFVEKTSAVNKAGLGVMTALNEGDLSRAYRLLGAKLNSNTTNSYDSRRYNTTDSHNTTTNHVRIFNSSRSAVNTSYRGLRNIMALR